MQVSMGKQFAKIGQTMKKVFGEKRRSFYDHSTENRVFEIEDENEGASLIGAFKDTLSCEWLQRKSPVHCGVIRNGSEWIAISLSIQERHGILGVLVGIGVSNASI